MKLLIVLAGCSILAIGQTAANWDVAQSTDALAAQAGRLKPLLDELAPDDWVKSGASATYVDQWRHAENELKYLTDSARLFAKEPDRLTLALDCYFRMQALEIQLNSLVDGVRRYQDPAIADQMLSVLGANSAHRDQLREYISDLASTREQEFKVADQEAQRCRNVLNRQPAPPAQTKKKAAPKQQ